MAKRYLRIDVEWTQSSAVYVVIDDELTPLTIREMWKRAGIESPDLTPELCAAAIAAAKTLSVMEWGYPEDEDYSAGPVNEVTEAEAKQYQVIDLTQRGAGD